MEDVTYLSDEKKKELELELEDLKNVKRREIAAKINEAKEQGDLSENAEYHQAREEQGFIEGRILELEDILRRALIVKHTADHATIRVGSQVKVIVDGKERDLEIVGSQEAEPGQGKRPQCPGG